MAGEAVLLRGGRPATMVRRWRRQLHLVVAFETAEVMRCQLCGLDDPGQRRESRPRSEPVPVVLDDATLGRIEENRLLALATRARKQAQQRSAELLVEDEDVFEFGGDLGGGDDSLHVSALAAELVSSLPVQLGQQVAQGGDGDISPSGLRAGALGGASATAPGCSASSGEQSGATPP